MFLGVDGGGTKTAFILIDEDANVLARHQEASAYYLETGLDATRAMLGRGIAATLATANARADDVRYAFFGLPAYGEDSTVQPALDALPGAFLNPNQYRCDCDMICSWAGSLACADGISVISGTGSMAYGEYAGRGVRAGGWGELFSDEGSAYWIAREGLTLFSKMSDGRCEQGPLYSILKNSFGLKQDLDLCGFVYTILGAQRSAIAQISQLVAQAASSGDLLARNIFERAAAELVAIVVAVRRGLNVPDGVSLPVSYSGGVFDAQTLLLAPFRHGLYQHPGQFLLITPLMEPAVGAAIYAAKCAGFQFGRDALHRLSKA